MNYARQDDYTCIVCKDLYRPTELKIIHHTGKNTGLCSPCLEDSLLLNQGELITDLGGCVQ